MRALLALPLLTLSVFSIHADDDIYLNFAYGFNLLSTNETTIFTDDRLITDTKLTPTNNDGTWGVNLGYRINDAITLEAGFQHIQTNATKVTMTQNPSEANNQTSKYNVWETFLEANKLSLTTLYTMDVDNFFQVNAGLGVTLLQYEFSSNTSVLQNSLQGNVNLGPIPNMSVPANKSETKLGALATLGFDYKIWENLVLGADANINIDGTASTMQLLGTVGYHF